jgi:superoxide dismutase, Fe-Mn family
MPSPFSLPALPYAEDALAPVISAQTVGVHYGKHHKTYVDNLNRLVSGTEMESRTIEQIITAPAGRADKPELFNNAAQAWNHTFYWRSLRPGGGGRPGAELERRIAAAFGNYETFRKDFAKAAVSQFGSGWAWLAFDDGALKIVKTSNADTPLAHGQVPLLTVDVWEHAYYLDYQNRRADYVDAVLDRLINWGFAAENLARAEAAAKQHPAHA